ncbi:MAG: hypothetical protein IJ120_02675 [Solobacterium sp.]|nr:hypothetical protein [Solobacterium sp.]
MRFKIIARAEAFDHLQRGDGDVYIVEAINDDTPLGLLRNAEGFLLGIPEEQAQEPKTEAPAAEEAPKEEKTKLPPRRPRIDQGKVMALHRAGWNVSSIAMEVGCTSQSVRNIIEKHEGGEANNDTYQKN